MEVKKNQIKMQINCPIGYYHSLSFTLKRDKQHGSVSKRKCVSLGNPDLPHMDGIFVLVFICQFFYISNPRRFL